MGGNGGKLGEMEENGGNGNMGENVGKWGKMGGNGGERGEMEKRGGNEKKWNHKQQWNLQFQQWQHNELMVPELCH